MTASSFVAIRSANGVFPPHSAQVTMLGGPALSFMRLERSAPDLA